MTDDDCSTFPCDFNAAEPIPGYLVRERHRRRRLRRSLEGRCSRRNRQSDQDRLSAAATTSVPQRELSSLNRIKEVRHPFLLSLERIELVDGHLVIVTELADVEPEAGIRRVPRGRAARHSPRRAADPSARRRRRAGLHLPASIRCSISTSSPRICCWWADAIKVADFGLVKDLQDVEQLDRSAA